MCTPSGQWLVWTLDFLASVGRREKSKTRCSCFLLRCRVSPRIWTVIKVFLDPLGRCLSYLVSDASSGFLWMSRVEFSSVFWVLEPLFTLSGRMSAKVWRSTPLKCSSQRKLVLPIPKTTKPYGLLLLFLFLLFHYTVLSRLKRILECMVFFFFFFLLLYPVWSRLKQIFA